MTSGAVQHEAQAVEATSQAGAPLIREVAAGQTLVKRRRFTADEYQRMAEAGILHEDDRVELVEGEIIEMAAMGSRHGACVARTSRVFSRLPEDQVIVWTQNPIRLSDLSEPEPNIVALRYRADYYAEALPGPANVILLVEVADTSVAHDRRVKIPLYAAAGIPEVWLALVEAPAIEVYRTPNGDRYEQMTTHRRGETLTPIRLPEFAVRVEELLG